MQDMRWKFCGRTSADDDDGCWHVNGRGGLDPVLVVWMYGFMI